MSLVSIVIPTYNRAHMLGSAIQSVLDQTYDDWELIVVDDGSTDDTRELVSRYDDERIQYIYQDNKKLPGARNTGIRAGTGEFVAFLDSDDLFLPGKLDIQRAALIQDTDIGLVASGWTEIDLQHRPLRTHRPWQMKRGLALEEWLYGCPFIVPSVLIRRDWLARVGLFDERQHYVEDWDLWLRLAYAGCQMMWKPSNVCLRTIHSANMAHHATHMSEGVFRMFDKLFAEQNLPEFVSRQKDRVYANAHLDGAARAFAAGALTEGREHLKSAIQLNGALLEDEPPAILQSLASTALTHHVNNVDKYVDDVCRGLRDFSPRLAISRRQMRAMIWATSAFEDLASGHRSHARLQAARALFLDPTWLNNRGLLGILLKP